MPELIIYTRHSAGAVIEYEIRSDSVGDRLPTVLDILRGNGIILSAPCGGRKKCGRCAVWVSGDIEQPDENELAVLSTIRIKEEPPDSRFTLRLACSAKVTGRCEVYFPSFNAPDSGIDNAGSYLCGTGHNQVADNTAFSHYSPSFPHGVDSNREKTGPCRRVWENICKQDGVFFAFDLGTTTVSLRACSGGATVYEKTALSAQRAYGADVISRIAYCGSVSGGLEELRNAVTGQLTYILSEACGQLGKDMKESSVIPIAGNTTMQYLLCGISPGELGRYPYEPSERFGRFVTIEREGTIINAYLPRCTGGFTGGDLTCCLTAVEAARHSSPYISEDDLSHLLSVLPDGIGKYDRLMLCDLGTNGEIALFSGDDVYVTSAAAGPALEGGNISCGSGAVGGAVSRIYRLPGADGLRLGYDVIGGGEARSLSGCALLELTAILLDEGVIDETGRMDCDFYNVCGNISVTQADIRQLQLAKGAVRAAAERLLEIAGISSPDAVIITGGLGYRVDGYAVRRTGLLPECGNIFFTPALAMEGAMLCRDEKGRELSEKTAAHCRVAELSGDDRFDGLFLEHMEFCDSI